MEKGETGFICNYEFFMRNSCEKCPIARLCQEFEDKQKEKPEIEKKETIKNKK
jgi:hypothetical protein